MSQKLTPDGSQKGFSVGRGLLAAAETLNFSMGDSRSNQQLGGIMGLGGGDEKATDSQRPSRSSNQVGNTLKLFASLGLSPGDLDVLAQIPEENITVETLPHLLKQLKNRKPDNSSNVSGDLSRLFPSESSYRGNRNEWEGMQGGRMDRSSGNSSQNRSGDYGYGSSQDVSSRGYDSRNYGGGGRNSLFSDLSSDSYRSQGMSSSFGSDSLFMQRRVGAPSNGKIQDFLGVTPLMFPHVCAICDFDVHSSMEWTQHTAGMRHAEKCRVLLQLYPDWDPHMISGPRSDFSKRSDDLFGPSSFGDMRQRTGMGSNYGSDSNFAFDKSSMHAAAQKIRSRVVVVKYDQKPRLNALFNLANQFGSLRESLVLKNKAFLELQTHEEALALANFYQHKPAILNGNRVKIYLSRELRVIEKNENTDASEPSRVVFFSNMPKETKKKSELLTIARRFGTIVNHLFLSDQAFVQFSSPKDAEMLVKYYTVHPLTIARQSIKLNICTKYKTLKVVPGKGEQIKEGNEEMSKKGSTSKTSSKTSSAANKSKRPKSRESSSDRASRTKNKEDAKKVVGESSDKDENVEAHIDEEKKTVEESTSEQPNEETTIESEGTEKAEPEDDAQDANKEENPEETATNQENPSDEPAEHEEDQNQDVTNELEETDKQEDQDQPTADSLAEQEDLDNSDFPENMEEFVTLDELEEEEGGEDLDADAKEQFSKGRLKDDGGLRVVNVVGFKRSYGFLNEILALAKPFGKVVSHLVLHSRPETFLELENEEEARAMVRFYNGNVKPSVCGRVVKVYHSMTYATVQSVRVVYVGHIPPGKTAKDNVLKLTEPYGKVRRYYFNRGRNECFIEMEKKAAEDFVKDAKINPYRVGNQRVLVYISKKYKQLKHGIRPPSPKGKRPAKREHSGDEEPPTKKAKDEKPNAENVSTVAKDELMEEEDGVEAKEGESPSPEEEDLENAEKPSHDTTDENMETQQKSEDDELATEKNQEMNEQLAEIEKKPKTTLENLGSYDPVVPVGVEFLKTGFYCKLCSLFYSNEDAAKRIHCSSQEHYEKLKEHLEKQ